MVLKVKISVSVIVLRCFATAYNVGLQTNHKLFQWQSVFLELQTVKTHIRCRVSDVASAPDAHCFTFVRSVPAFTNQLDSRSCSNSTFQHRRTHLFCIARALEICLHVKQRLFHRQTKLKCRSNTFVVII